MKEKIPSAYILFVLNWVFFISGCAQQHAGIVMEKDGKHYGIVKSGIFRHRWWNYFERGLSYAEGKFYQNAVSDFQEAIRQRNKDQRRARTYGMHFIDYFPHRELGIVFFEKGDLENAKKELELSLSQFPSAKAQFYLDRVRKQMIEKDAKEITPPKLDLNIKTKTMWTRADPVILTGNVQDEHFIKTIKINNAPIFLAYPQKYVFFRKKLLLTQGRHVVDVEAYNIVGLQTRRQIAIFVDREGPVISIEDASIIESKFSQQITLSGSLNDQAGVDELWINGRQLKIQAGIEIFFTYQFSNNTEEIEIVGRDRLGNETTAKIRLKDIISIRDTSASYAGLSSDLDNSLQVAFFDTLDSSPPDVILKGWTNRQTVYLGKVFLEGQVKDVNNIIALEINKKKLLKRKGKFIFFSHIIELSQGENQIVIRARDAKGHETIKTIIIIRRIPKALQLSQRMSLTVLPFNQKKELTTVSNFFQDFLIEALVNQDRFQVVERNMLELILQEQKLSRTSLFNAKTALKVGRLVAAQSIVAGNIIHSRLGSEIIARVIDTETSDILAAVDVYDEVTNTKSLRSLSEGLALKIHREFPLIGGMVIQKKANSILSDLGKGEIKVSRRLIVFREEPIKHPLTGKWLGSDNVILGRAQVTQVMPELSKANILDGKPETIKPLDKVISE